MDEVVFFQPVNARNHFADSTWEIILKCGDSGSSI